MEAETPTSPEEWSRFLERRLKCPVNVVFGRSRSYPIQARAGRGKPKAGLVVRMHSMFAEAPSEVADSVATWLRSGRRARRACTLLDEWIDERTAQLPVPPVKRSRLRPGGIIHDLHDVARPLLAGTFATDFPVESPTPDLTWGRRGRSSSKRSLRLGSFDVQARLVRVHPVLDQPAVPEWFVRYVLFHELLHAAIPPTKGSGSRWIHHSRAFRERESKYADYERAMAWEEDNLAHLIRSARTGLPAHVPPP